MEFAVNVVVFWGVVIVADLVVVFLGLAVDQLVSVIIWDVIGGELYVMEVVIVLKQPLKAVVKIMSMVVLGILVLVQALHLVVIIIQ